MGSMPQYYPNDNTPQQNNREPPHLLSSSFIQSELNSPTQHFPNMSENGYQTTTDQFGIHTHSSSLAQPSAPMSEPPPYDEFVEYNWPTEMTANFALPSDEYNNRIFSEDDTQFIFGHFLGNLDDDSFIFNPSLPINMPAYPNPPSDNNDSSSSHHLDSPLIVGDTYNMLSGQVSSPTTLNQNQFSSNSTTLSPRTSSITLSSSPPLPPSNNVNNHDNNDGDDDVSSEGKADGSSTPTVPSKRKQENDNERNRRRTSIPRLSPINTKLAMTQSNNNNNSSSSNSNGSRPMSPSMQLSNLSINNNNNNGNNNINHNNHNNNNYDDSPGSSSNNNSPSPRTPNREIIDAKDDDDDLVSANTNNLSSIDDQNDDFSPTEIKTEDATSSSKPTPQKSSRKPYKELLTEEEKRANHIASEQKRRNTIRAGFKELTDIIPTLKNVNNSKSTILFKAVDYIKYLERRNRNLKERAGLLEMRVEMEMRQGKRFHHHHHPHGNPFGPTTMGFGGHQRVAPMQMSYGVIPNGMTAIPIGPSGHPPQRQPPHVMTPHHQIYFVPSNENPPSMIPSGVVSPTNNLFSRNAAMGMQIPLSSQQQNHHHPQENVPGMNIPTIASDDDGNNGGVDIDGDSSMLGMNGNATRVGVKC